MYRNFLKRIFDLVFSCFAFLLLFPVFLILVFILMFINNGKPFYFQKRPGKNEKIFKIIKFKSMTDKKDAKGNLLPDKDRVTKFGDFIRKYSLDEIPQLLNIIKGDMSLIGPRPLRVQYLPFYTDNEKIRHTIKPGVTGLAQVSGRNALNWDQKLLLDIEYVEKMNIMLDLKIFFKTIEKVLTASNTELGEDIIDLNEYRK